MTKGHILKIYIGTKNQAKQTTIKSNSLNKSTIYNKAHEQV